MVQIEFKLYHYPGSQVTVDGDLVDLDVAFLSEDGRT